MTTDSSHSISKGAVSVPSLVAEYVRSQVALQTQGLEEKMKAHADGQLVAMARENHALRQKIAVLEDRLAKLEVSTEEYRQWENQIHEYLNKADADIANIEFFRWRLELLISLQKSLLFEPTTMKERTEWLAHRVDMIERLDRRKSVDKEKAKLNRRASDRMGG